jgi:beta-glucosidase-like glycosyl hydrolase
MLSLEQKLYQLIINRLDGVKLSSSSYRERAMELVQKGVGGFIIFGGKKDEVRSFVDNLQSVSEMPLFIASDIERGVGQQIEGATRFSCQMAVSAAINKNRTDDVKILHDAIHAVAREAIDTGINMPLIPVLDVNRNPDNPIICTRAFSDDPEEVAWYGNTYIKIIEDAGLISCAKHFPGHGDTSIDSHIELPVILKSRKDLLEIDIYPFVEAVKAGVSSIMVGHLSVPAIDTLPATLSEKIITDLLRKELSYEGLVSPMH